MIPTPGNDNLPLRGETGVRRAAMAVIDEFGESAADYAVTRAIVLQRQGDDVGASAWRRVAPVIEEMQRKKAPVLIGANSEANHSRLRQAAFEGLREEDAWGGTTPGAEALI